MIAWRAAEPGSRRVGVEHEYQLFNPEDSAPLDARTLLPTLDIDGARLDPADPLAVRCHWGGVITADGREAEVATPPRLLGASGIGQATALADVGAAELRRALPPIVTVRGYSTHLNVEIDDRRGLGVARSIAERMAPAIMLLMDRRTSPGLLVRPRYRRLELAGEFVRGERLQDALIMAVGVVLASESALRSRRARCALPPRLALDLTGTPQRYGLYVDRRAGGPDLYARGRACRLRTRDQGSITAQEVLTRTWAAARPHVAGFATSTALSRLDAVVAGTAPLGLEASEPAWDRPAATACAVTPSRSVLGTRRRGDVVIATTAATWHAVVLRAERHGTTRWLLVPGENIESFLTALDDGRLDSWLARQFGTRLARFAGAQS